MIVYFFRQLIGIRTNDFHHLPLHFKSFIVDPVAVFYKKCSNADLPFSDFTVITKPGHKFSALSPTSSLFLGPDFLGLVEITQGECSCCKWLALKVRLLFA